MSFPNGGFNSGSGWDQRQYAYQTNPEQYQQSPMTQQMLHPGTDYSHSAFFSEHAHDGTCQDFLPAPDNSKQAYYSQQGFPVLHQVVHPSPPNFNQFPVGIHPDQVNSYDSFHPHNDALVLPPLIENPSRQGWIPANQDLVMSGRGGSDGGRSTLQERDQVTPIHVRSSLLLYKNNHENPPRETRRRYNSSTSAGCSSSSSSDTSKEARHPRLSNEELHEFAALIQDLWRDQRFAQEFKKYSVSEFNRIRAILQKIESDNSRCVSRRLL